VHGWVARLYDLAVSIRLETARLVIRSFEARDGGPWLAMVNDPEVSRFLPPEPDATMELARRVIGERQAMERELGHAMWAVDDKMTGTFVGQCGLRPVDEGSRVRNRPGYHYTRASWNKGYGTEAAVAVLAHGLGHLREIVRCHEVGESATTAPVHRVPGPAMEPSSDIQLFTTTLPLISQPPCLVVITRLALDPRIQGITVHKGYDLPYVDWRGGGTNPVGHLVCRSYRIFTSFAFFRFAVDRSAPDRSAPDRSAFSKLASRSCASRNVALCRSAL
jgi:RimJ/RimL family protein N-acetyltransferase